jgi:hypothetical protein
VRLDEEYLEFARAEEIDAEELCREELETLGTVPTIECYNPKMDHTGLPGIRPTHASS